MACHVWHIIHSLKYPPQRGVGDILLGYEHFYALTCNESRECGPNVRGTILCKPSSVLLLTMSSNSVISGVIMSLIGIFYMISEPMILSDFSYQKGGNGHNSSSLVSRTVTGVQVRKTALRFFDGVTTHT